MGCISRGLQLLTHQTHLQGRTAGVHDLLSCGRFDRPTRRGFQLGEAGLSAYVTAKGAIVAMSRSHARELGPDHIRVNTLSPGWVMTERQLRLYVNDEVKERILKDQCIPTLIESEEIAEVALFLASNTSRAITGQNIAVNRGWTHI